MNVSLRSAIGCLAVLMAMSSLSFADTATLSASKDNSLITDAAGAVGNGAGSVIFAGRTGQVGPGAIRGLVAFDIAASIPAGASITGVSLELLITNSNDSQARDYSLHAVTQDWGEGDTVANGGNGAPTMPGDATWVHTFYDSSFWNTPGGDFEATASATSAVSEVAGSTAVWDSAGLVSDVQGWLDTPGSNFGWLLMGDEVNDRTARGFGSRESVTSVGPMLTVTFETVPEPSGLLMLVSVVGLLMLKRSGS
jgi:hypothetical protein